MTGTMTERTKILRAKIRVAGRQSLTPKERQEAVQLGVIR